MPASPRLALGLMSGTSADGVSTALIEIAGGGALPRIRLRFHRTYPYAHALRLRILALPQAGAAELCRMNMDLGETFARVALRALRDARVRPARLALIASHGQTVWHIPRAAGKAGATLQIGEPSVIAERTGVTVVADFRPRDIAAGGEGAPLVPLLDGLLFRPARAGVVRCVQNIGGIANVTVVSRAGVEAAFDTGPGNGVIDAAMRRITGGKSTYDRGGRVARAGRVDERVVADLLRDPYFRRPPPKSTGRERFGDAFTAALAGPRGADLVATLTRFVAQSIHDAYRRFVLPRFAVEEILVSGGGARNPTLMHALREACAPIPVRTTDAAGVPGDAREAMAFALLGWETLHGRAGNVPMATGARRAAVLGKIVPRGG